jgi:UDP-N-acetylglucosamine--N-acetylmuramyl-(pentapeptide) pyrophosphoryl-undecaprenol N-acetylglucosamine transferase
MSAHSRQPEIADAGIAKAATVLLAGGGTGGHISPGLAVAEALADMRPDLGRVFACSQRDIDRTMLVNAGEVFIPIGAMPFGHRPAQILRFLRGWRRAMAQTIDIIDSNNVRVVIALGGFVAAPAIAAARRRGVPRVLLNLDAVPGKANRYIAHRGAETLTACDITAASARFEGSRVSMPLRRSTLASSFGDPRHCRIALGLDPHRPTLLITGASQGSQSINDLIQAIVKHHCDWLAGWQIHHLTGHGREGDLAAMYRAAGISAVVEPFRNEMGLAWGAADLAISRAGANSVAEIAANAVPAIFFPYPHHMDRHQFHNAIPLVEAGGAAVCEDHVDPGRNLDQHGETLRRALRNPHTLDSMRQALAACRPHNGAQAVAARLIAMIK